jgi:tetratricopeptide (TPR) repeat protein
LTNLETTILRYQGRLAEAAELVQPAVRALARIRSGYPDSKHMLEIDADLRENLGAVWLAQGDAQKAVIQFRESLNIRRQRLGGRTPTQQSFAVMFDRSRPVSWREVEPMVIADYCETQLRLAAALSAVGRPYEAGCTLGDAAFNAQIINNSHLDILAFWVLHANAVAAVGQHLNEQESGEADHYLQVAAALWNEMRAEFPEAEKFQSGARGQRNDWDWFRTTLPDYADNPGTRESLKLNNWNTAFWQHMLGRSWFENEAWESSVNHFTKSAELRKSERAYDWLHLAMAYHHLDQPEKAKTEFDRAVAGIQTAATPDAELEELRRRAARLLAEDTVAESN